MRILLWAFMGLALSLSPVQAARHALIVGNANYTEIGKLQNTLNDAAAYRDAFEYLGFNVTYIENADRDQMEESLAAFYDTLAIGDQVAFVFSGHGWSDGVENFLAPIDAPKNISMERLKQISSSLGNRANGVLDELEKRKPSRIIAIVDACRNNPFLFKGKKSIVGKGLTVERAPQGSVVIFSAANGQEALDRLPEDSPTDTLSVFSRNFVPLLTQPITLEDAFFEARSKTYRAAQMINHEQRPAVYFDTVDKTCLNLNGECQSIAAAARPSEVDDRPIPLEQSFVVDASGLGHFTEIGTAIRSAPPGWSIKIRPGSYSETEEIVIDKSISLIGDGPREQIHVDLLERINWVSGDGVIQGFSLRKNVGEGDRTAILFGSGQIIFKNMIVENPEGYGVKTGVAFTGSSLKVEGSKFTGKFGIKAESHKSFLAPANILVKGNTFADFTDTAVEAGGAVILENNRFFRNGGVALKINHSGDWSANNQAVKVTNNDFYDNQAAAIQVSNSALLLDNNFRNNASWSIYVSRRGRAYAVRNVIETQFEEPVHVSDGGWLDLFENRVEVTD